MGGKSKNTKRMMNALVNHPKQTIARRLAAKTAERTRPPVAKKAQAQPKAKGKSIVDQFVHPDGRVAARLRNKLIKKDKMAQKHFAKDKLVRRSLERPLWFKAQLSRHPEGYFVPSMEEMVQWVRRYIGRNDGQINVLSERRRGGPRISGLEKDLCMKRAAEREEFSRGFKVPDLLTRKSCQKLRIWTGTADTLHLVPQIEVANPAPVEMTGRPKVPRKKTLAIVRKNKQIRVPGTSVKAFTAAMRMSDNQALRRRQWVLRDRKARRHAAVASKRTNTDDDDDPIL